MKGPAVDPALGARKLRDASVLLPLAGLVLLMPPVALVLSLPARIGGVPVVVIYVFLVWAFLILAARAVGRRMADKEGGRAD